MTTTVHSMQELQAAVKAGADEIVVADPGVESRVRLFDRLRTGANIAVYLILAGAVLLWANPFRIAAWESVGFLWLRRVVLGLGILLLFADRLLPVVRFYQPDKSRKELVLVRRGRAGSAS